MNDLDALTAMTENLMSSYHAADELVAETRHIGVRTRALEWRGHLSAMLVSAAEDLRSFGGNTSDWPDGTPGKFPMSP